MKNKLSLLFVLLAVICVFSSCGSSDSDTGDRTASDADREYLDYIGIEDMNGYNFRMLLRPGMIVDQYVEEETGDIVNDAVYRRNETVKTLFNIDISYIESTASNGGDAINTILAGDDQFDVILPHSRTAFQYAVQNTVVNFNNVKTLDLTKEWWSKDIVDSANINGHLYVLDGDFQTQRLSSAFTMYFNKRIFDELGLDYPYNLVLNDNWTFDAFSKLVKQGTKDLNGDGLIKVEDDQFGYSTKDWYGPIQVLYSGGQRIYTKNSKGTPTLTLNSPKTVQIFSEFFNLANSEDVFLQLDKVRMYEGDLFREGRAMFADVGLGSAKGFRSMNDEFGILPWPKFSKEDKFATVVNGHASLLVMPVTVEDYDRTGKIIEALCAVGHRDVIPAFYDVSLKTKFSRDYESEDMIDIIKDSIIYDLGYVAGGAFQSVGYDLAHKTNPDFASYYASSESKAVSDLNNFLASYGKLNK